MVLREAVLEGLDQAGRGDRAGDERDADRLERRGRQRLRGAGPPRSCGDRPTTVDEAGDAGVAHGVVDLGRARCRPRPSRRRRSRRSPRPATACRVRRAGSADRRASRGCPASCPRPSRWPASARRRSRNQAFCFAPRMRLRRPRPARKFGTCAVAEADRLRRLAVRVGRGRRRGSASASSGTKLREVVARAAARASSRPLGSSRAVAVLVGDEQVEVPAPAQRAIGREAADGGEVVGLLAEAVVVEALDRRVAAPRARRSARATARRRCARAPAGTRTRPGWPRPSASAPGRALPPKTWNDCQPMPARTRGCPTSRTNGQRARASCRSGSLQVGAVERAVVVERSRARGSRRSSRRRGKRTTSRRRRS